MRTLLALTLALLSLVAAGCPKRSASDGAAPSQVRKATSPVAPHSGLPVRLELPPGADSHGVDPNTVSTQQQTTGSRSWAIPFTYTGGFPTVQASFDQQLKDHRFSRVLGPNTDHDPGFTPGQGALPSGAFALKTWISADKRTIVFLHYNFARAAKGKPAVENYRLEVMDFDKPQPVNPPSKTAPIP